VCLGEAASCAQEATRRGWRTASYWQLAAQTKWLQADSDNFKYWNPPASEADKDAKVTQARQASALANAYVTRGDHELSRRELEKASGNDAAAEQSLAKANADYAAAEQAMEKAIELDETSWMLHARLGNALWLSGKHDLACAQWGMAAGMAPRAALDEAKVGAIDFAARAVALDPMNSRTRLWAAQFFCDVREPQMCLSELEAAKRIQAALLRPSLEAFSRTELLEVEMLQKRAQCIGH
jgi:hypothetical protein